MAILDKNEIHFAKIWHVATKHVKEDTFFIQPLRSLEHKQRRWEKLNKNIDMEFYFFEMEVPQTRKHFYED